MRPVTAVPQVFEAIQSVKTGASAFCTNFFPAEATLQRWVEHGELCGYLQNHASIFLRKDRDFWHLYYCAADLESLRRGMAALAAFKAERIAMDLVGKGDSLQDVLGVMETSGFRRHSRLIRLARVAQPREREASVIGVEVTLAEQSDCAAIMNLLEASFDRYADQLPAPYEMEAAVAARQVLAIKSDGMLAALLHFETQGLTSTVRFWVVDPRFKAQRLGSALMRHYLAAQPAVRRFILWVTATKEDVVAKYRHYGYQPDGLVDHVLVNSLICE